MSSLYESYEPRNGNVAWYVFRVALVQGGLVSGRAGESKVIAPVGHTEEVRRNRRRKGSERTLQIILVAQSIRMIQHAAVTWKATAFLACKERRNGT